MGSGSLRLSQEVNLAPLSGPIRLSLALDTTAFYWLALQARYDLERGSPSSVPIVRLLTKRLWYGAFEHDSYPNARFRPEAGDDMYG